MSRFTVEVLPAEGQKFFLARHEVLANPDLVRKAGHVEVAYEFPGADRAVVFLSYYADGTATKPFFENRTGRREEVLATLAAAGLL